MKRPPPSALWPERPCSARTAPSLRSLGHGPPDLEAVDIAEGDLVLDYGAMPGQANFMTIGRPGIGKL